MRCAVCAYIRIYTSPLILYHLYKSVLCPKRWEGFLSYLKLILKVFKSSVISGRDPYYCLVVEDAEAGMKGDSWRNRLLLKNWRITGYIKGCHLEICLMQQTFIQHKPSGLEGYFSALLEKALFCGLCRHAITFLICGRKDRQT